jgi:hypothetical protein
VVVAVLAAALPARGAATTWTHGYDVSWPQCSGSAAHHVPARPSSYVVLGLTDGAGHTRNPCLGSQLAWARNGGARVGAYLVASYPTAQQRAAASSGRYGQCSSLTCRLHNDGAAQAADAVAVMRRAGLAAPMVWIDVEFRHTYRWSSHHDRNRDVVEGIVRGLRASGVAVGVYSTSYMWEHTVGRWRLTVPNWVPSGAGRAATKRMCGGSATGGVTWVVQMTHTWDEDLTCPVLDAVPGRPGPLWPYRHSSLSLGSTGDAVSALQRVLDATQTGTYDVSTTAVVAQWQQAKALPVTGSIGERDWRALGAFKRVGGHPFLLRRMTGR